MMIQEVKEPLTHLWKKECGCVTEVIVDVPRMANEIKKAKRTNKRRHETYSLVETQSVREMEWTCPEHKALEERLKRERENE